MLRHPSAVAPAHGAMAGWQIFRPRIPQWSTMIPYAGAIFLGAFLLFLVQPIIAKQILPWFGGSAAVWATCMVFFQMVLLVGYTYCRPDDAPA